MRSRESWAYGAFILPNFWHAAKKQWNHRECERHKKAILLFYLNSTLWMVVWSDIVTRECDLPKFETVVSVWSRDKMLEFCCRSNAVFSISCYLSLFFCQSFSHTHVIYWGSHILLVAIHWNLQYPGRLNFFNLELSHLFSGASIMCIILKQKWQINPPHSVMILCYGSFVLYLRLTFNPLLQESKSVVVFAADLQPYYSRLASCEPIGVPSMDYP